MARISVAVSGDKWCNPAQVLDLISQQTKARHLVLDLNTEGPSLHALGIVDAVCEAAGKKNIMPDKIWVDRWHNPVERVPFKRARRPGLSHFFWLSENYRHEIPDAASDRRVFGLFIGRATVERAVIMHELSQIMPDHVLMSLMRNHGAGMQLQGDISNWVAASADQIKLRQWFDSIEIDSITQHEVRDQYRGGANTNAALIKHYDRFCIEIVCESYCLGETFFPTEKTVRPLSQGKPMIIFGPRQFLARLRALGFETYRDIWDESYDLLAGTDRWTAIKDLMHDILERCAHQHSRLRDIALHNKHTLEQLIQRNQPR